MPMEILSEDVLHNRDAIELPSTGVLVEGRAERRDAYPILVTRTLDHALAHLVQLIGDARVAVITDRDVDRLHGGAFRDALREHGIEPEWSVVAPGESNKTMAQTVALLDWLTQTDLSRRDVILTFGGGVINDMGGWVASCYMRGVPYVNVPTTLIGQATQASAASSPSTTRWSRT